MGSEKWGGWLYLDALDKVEEALARERTLSQLAHEIVADVLHPDVRVGRDERAHEGVRVA